MVQIKVFVAFILLGAAAIVPVAALPLPDQNDGRTTGEVSKCSMIIFGRFVTDIQHRRFRVDHHSNGSRLR